MSTVPPEVPVYMTAFVAWLWATYGKAILERAGTKALNKARWTTAVSRYLDSLYDRVGTVHILGQSDPVPLENVFTHVNLLDKVLAERRYNIAQFREEFDPRAFAWDQRVTRIEGDEALDLHDRLFILGKPGAGKTTFLKHAAHRAIRGEIEGVPIFVSLKELSDSGKSIFDFIAHQLDVHGVPKAKELAKLLLEGGDALVLLDGLDEVTLSDDRRSKLIAELNDFIDRYVGCPMVMTCRVAASDYRFDQFTYAEMADFDEQQIKTYIGHWFKDDPERAEQCYTELFRSEHKPVRELAQVPLLLSMLCLIYEDLGEFPSNRSEIYREAIRALLSKLDSSRNIRRDAVYKQLTLKRKEGLLAHLAYESFVRGDYFLKERGLERQIEAYLSGVPGLEEPDGHLVLQAMEAHHGIMVKRAAGIHSFSHLILQEYLAAQHIVDNEAHGALDELLRYIGDTRWDDVFLLVAAQFPDAKAFVRQYRAALDKLIANDSELVDCLAWAEAKRRQYDPPFEQAGARALILHSVVHLTLIHAISRDSNISFDAAYVYMKAFVAAHRFPFDPAHDSNNESGGFQILPDPKNDIAIKATREVTSVHIFLRSLANTLDDDLNLVSSMHNAVHMGIFYANHSHNVESALTWAVKHQAHEFIQAIEKLEPPETNADGVRGYPKEFVDVVAQFAALWDPHQIMPIDTSMLDERWEWNEEQTAQIMRYLQATSLLVRCLDVADLPESARREIEDSLLLPPAV